MAEEKNVAKKSSSNVERMIGVRNTNCRPSITDVRLNSACRAAPRRSVRSFIWSSAAITATNDNAFSA